MVILGLHDNHGASAALLVDGNIVAAVEEERFTRVKMDSGFPKQAVDYLREKYGDIFRALDYVAVGCIHQDLKDLATKRYPRFGIKEFLVEEQRFWIPRLDGQEPDYLDVMREYVDYASCHYPLHTITDSKDERQVRQMRQMFIARYVNVDPECVRFVDHHTCHAHHAYFSSPLRDDVLIFTVDGWGDSTNATVHVVREDGTLKCLYRTELCNLGRIYHFITLLLGMKPEQHEYKVMGLAAYAKDHHIREALALFEETYYVDGLQFRIDQPIANHYQYFRKALEGYRFDAIAGAVQRYTENMLVEWMDNWIRHTGLSSIVFSGGLALNIKASKRIAELPRVKNMFISLAGGDESLPIGAAQATWNGSNSPQALQPITNPYLGAGFDEGDIEEALSHPLVRKDYDIVRGVTEKEIAELLVEGQVVALMTGPMEFGPRALGHRSLLADPRDPGIVRVINEIIKNRDFWMPFTPSILAERGADYLVNPKKLLSPYMTLAFDSTELARKDLPAAIHPYDLTVRPQLVTREYAPTYYAIIKEFERLSGVGALLNTSLNIHGKPIVRKPIDAVNEILAHEGVSLECVVFEDVLLRKKIRTVRRSTNRELRRDFWQRSNT